MAKLQRPGCTVTDSTHRTILSEFSTHTPAEPSNLSGQKQSPLDDSCFLITTEHFTPAMCHHLVTLSRPGYDLRPYNQCLTFQPGSSLSEQIKVVVTRGEVYVLDMLMMTSAEKVKKYDKFSRTIRRRTNYSEVCQFGKTSQGRLSTTKDCCMLLE